MNTYHSFPVIKKYIALLIASFLFLPGLARPAGPDQDKLLRARYLRNYDGDTLTVEIKCRIWLEETVRLIGIDCEEKGENRFSKMATEFTRDMVRDRNLYLEVGTDQRDRYRRLLAYVWVEKDDGSMVMLNEILLQKGLAELMTIQPNVKYVDRFKEAVRVAQKNETGLWAEGGPGKSREAGEKFDDIYRLVKEVLSRLFSYL